MGLLALIFFFGSLNDWQHHGKPMCGPAELEPGMRCLHNGRSESYDEAVGHRPVRDPGPGRVIVYGIVLAGCIAGLVTLEVRKVRGK